MNEQIKAIRNEIKRRMEKHWDLLPDADSPEDDWTHNEFAELGAYKELEHLETFVDSLPESNCPKLSDNSLEDEMINYWGRIPDDKDLIDTARHFALWGKEQMMKDAVAVEVVGEKRDLRLIDSTQRCLFNAERGDWLRVVIVKEDER